MSARLFFAVLLWVTVLAVFGLSAATRKGYTLCDVPGCNCTVPAGSWKNVNCNLHDDQELRLEPGHIPTTVTEISISGGSVIAFAPKVFSGLPAFTLLRLDGVKRVLIETKSFYNINSSSLLVQIIGCDDLVINNGAFEEMLGTLSVEVVSTNSVIVGRAPFSKLINCTFQNIGKLTLSNRAFEIKNMRTATNERHGPVTVVILANVVISEPLYEVFLTSLAQITFRDSHVGDVGPEAFKPTEISAVQMINTTFGTVMTGAFTDRTLIKDFLISKCTISRLQTKAVMAGMAKLTVNHSIITEIETNAIISTVANVEIVGNEILTFNRAGFVISNWNRIVIDQNIIKNLHRNFVEAPVSAETELFTFKGNEIYNLMEGSLSFVATLDPSHLVFDDNYFDESCSCEMSEWIESLTNGTDKLQLIMDTSFCTVDEILANCFSMQQGVINIQNFTDRTCYNNTVCEPYNGETRVIDTTSRIFVEDTEAEKRTWLIVIFVVIALFILVLVSTFVALLVRGSRWLKRKGYFRNQYYNNHPSNEEENTIVTVDTDNDKLEIPDELTIEFLHVLSKRLDDPATHQEASEMIERLYEMFIIDDSYENNNREEEVHLYEELGNLNLQIPPPPYEEQEKPQSPVTNSTGPRGILKLMEEKFYGGTQDGGGSKPTLTGEYSEPTDAAVHLYSELKHNLDSKKDGAQSNGTTSIALKPLQNNADYFFKAGPSSKS
ncbi:uncharacterized protein LOC132707628 [Cylas formicarius]|uniref:uncharacterized protein LOC132707628 n=1 Tax=Cylas formicarius TaxID=197179 RepID=UPI00295894FC|nr:uncharacterized protein LOC132707628 [Cylas formicarius]